MSCAAREAPVRLLRFPGVVWELDVFALGGGDRAVPVGDRSRAGGEIEDDGVEV